MGKLLFAVYLHTLSSTYVAALGITVALSGLERNYPSFLLTVHFRSSEKAFYNNALEAVIESVEQVCGQQC